ncbi:hypothetical protein [Streptomyces europaeiscabiei]|uniref:hypothetical protein n=1 Tax=Streptomyces europaeiscabiei TaxID=146819 RepID=UPI0029BCB796|nr:hypothetical protein [Streptomyces europaeiscabiei]MDX3587604.1 hypothetical protein [Streptomyces europaeiscabiei]
MGSSFAAVAAGATLWTLLSQQRQIKEQREFIGEQSTNLGLERAELHAQAADRRIAQARRVDMRITTLGDDESTRYGHGPNAVTLGPVNRWAIWVMNNSDGPIRDVNVRFGGSIDAEWGEESGAWLTIDRERREPPIPVLACGHTLELESPRWEEEGMVKRNRPVLHFTDNAGTRWLLDEFGHLEEQL